MCCRLDYFLKTSLNLWMRTNRIKLVVGRVRSFLYTEHTHIHTHINTLLVWVYEISGLQLPQQLTLPQRPAAGMSEDAFQLNPDLVTSPRVLVKKKRILVVVYNCPGLWLHPRKTIYMCTCVCERLCFWDSLFILTTTEITKQLPTIEEHFLLS